jgi:hypothetical protein
VKLRITEDIDGELDWETFEHMLQKFIGDKITFGFDLVRAEVKYPTHDEYDEGEPSLHFTLRKKVENVARVE